MPSWSLSSSSTLCLYNCNLIPRPFCKILNTTMCYLLCLKLALLANAFFNILFIYLIQSPENISSLTVETEADALFKKNSFYLYHMISLSSSREKTWMNKQKSNEWKNDYIKCSQKAYIRVLIRTIWESSLFLNEARSSIGTSIPLKLGCSIHPTEAVIIMFITIKKSSGCKSLF